MIQKTTLQNGLRILTDRSDAVDSVAMGVYFGVGTRNEDLHENGIAHLVEHMMFKGTKTRNALDIVQAIENVGGQMNAFTSREITGYYLHMLKDDVMMGVEILADMLQNSVFDPAELERERQVILQEIGMAIDTPDDLVFDHYQQTAYPGQTLGAPILGSAAIVAGMPRAAIERYVRDLYTPKNMVISAAGNVRHDEFVAAIERLFVHLPADSVQHPAPANYQGGEVRTPKDLEQAHVILGFRGISRSDARYYDVVGLAHILGGGMSSRLFQSIREQRGLVYNIYAFHAALRDDGQFAVYAGTGPDRLDELMKVLPGELKATQLTITRAEIDRTRAQLKANLLMGRESMTTRADQNARYLIHHDQVIDTDVLRARIDAITIESVQAIARTVFAGTPTLAALGPIGRLPKYEEIAGAMAA